MFSASAVRFQPSDPGQADSGARSPSRGDEVRLHSGPCKVLIVDDEHLIARNHADMVRDLGHSVVGIAGDRERAADMARQHTPHLVLMDINLRPEPNVANRDGIETASDIYTELGVPSLIISAYSNQDYLDHIQAKGLESGVFGYLLKPVSLEDLRVQISLVHMQGQATGHRERRIEQLQRNLADRRTVEQAKWMLVQQHAQSEPDAHKWLQQTARNQRKPLLEIAQGVIAGQLKPE